MSILVGPHRVGLDVEFYAVFSKIAVLLDTSPEALAAEIIAQSPTGAAPAGAIERFVAGYHETLLDICQKGIRH